MAAKKTSARKSVKARTARPPAKKKAAAAPSSRAVPLDDHDSAAHGIASRAGTPPVGTIGEDAIERLIGQWIRRPKQPADFAHLPRAAVLTEARAMLGAREDLVAFASAATPINARALDYLEVLIRHAEPELTGKEVAKIKPVPTSRPAQDALEDVVETLRTVFARAEACGRPLRMYELGKPPWSARGFITQVLHVVQAGRRRVEKWDDPTYALRLFTKLEQDTLKLEAAWKLPTTADTDDEAELRRLALSRLLYDATTYIAAYGRAVFGVSDARRARYTLSALFPEQKNPAVRAPLKLLEGPA